MGSASFPFAAAARRIIGVSELPRGFLGMPYSYCGDCGRLVYFKPILGTLHPCLTDDERAIKGQIEQMQRAQDTFRPQPPTYSSPRHHERGR